MTDLKQWITNKVFLNAVLTEVIQHLCLISADVFQMPRLRQYPNRYVAA